MAVDNLDPLGFPPTSQLLDPYATNPTNTKVPRIAEPPVNVFTDPLFPSGSGDGDAVITATNVLQQIIVKRDADGNRVLPVVIPLSLTQALVVDAFSVGTVGVSFEFDMMFAFSGTISAFAHPSFTILSAVLDTVSVSTALVGVAVHSGSLLRITLVSSTTNALFGNITLTIP